MTKSEIIKELFDTKDNITDLVLVSYRKNGFDVRMTEDFPLEKLSLATKILNQSISESLSKLMTPLNRSDEPQKPTHLKTVQSPESVS